MTEPEDQDRPDAGQPGSGSTPSADGQDAGDLADVGDRTDDGAPAANQGKTEPFPPGAGDDAPDQTEQPDRGAADVGAAHPQAPRPEAD